MAAPWRTSSGAGKTGLAQVNGEYFHARKVGSAEIEIEWSRVGQLAKNVVWGGGKKWAIDLCDVEKMQG